MKDINLNTTNNAWLMTLMDLVLLLVCFFVFIFSYNTQVKNAETNDGIKVYKETSGYPKRAKQAGQLKIISHNLSEIFDKNKITFNTDDEKGILKIVFDPSLQENNSIQFKQNLFRALYLNDKNKVKIKLIMFYDKIVQNAKKDSQLIEEKVFNLLDYANQLRSLLQGSRKNNLQLEIDISPKPNTNILFDTALVQIEILAQAD